MTATDTHQPSSYFTITWTDGSTETIDVRDWSVDRKIGLNRFVALDPLASSLEIN